MSSCLTFACSLSDVLYHCMIPTCSKFVYILSCMWRFICMDFYVINYDCFLSVSPAYCFSSANYCPDNCWFIEKNVFNDCNLIIKMILSGIFLLQMYNACTCSNEKNIFTINILTNLRKFDYIVFYSFNMYSFCNLNYFSKIVSSF